MENKKSSTCLQQHHITLQHLTWKKIATRLFPEQKNPKIKDQNFYLNAGTETNSF